MTVLLHGQVKNTASSDVRELLAVCSKAVNYAKSKSCQSLADLEPGTSTAVKNTGKMLPWTRPTTQQIKHSLFHSTRQYLDIGDLKDGSSSCAHKGYLC